MWFTKRAVCVRRQFRRLAQRCSTTCGHLFFSFPPSQQPVALQWVFQGQVRAGSVHCPRFYVFLCMPPFLCCIWRPIRRGGASGARASGSERLRSEYWQEGPFGLFRRQERGGAQVSQPSGVRDGTKETREARVRLPLQGHLQVRMKGPSTRVGTQGI